MASAPSMASMGSGKKPTREQMKKFLETGIAMMKSDETRQLLKDPELAKPGLHLKDLQRAGWDPEGIDRDIGCKALDEIEPTDKELAPLQGEFLHTSMRVYLRSLQDRKPAELERVKGIPRETIVEFFDSCNVRMQLPETHKTLAAAAKSVKGPPRQAIIDIQREQLEILGFEADHGCKKLSEISETYPHDKDLHGKFQQWAGVATNMGNQIVRMVAQEEMANDPEKRKMVEKVQEDLGKMTPEERGELVMKMQKRVETIRKLPPNEQEAYIEKQGPEFKHEFMKVQVLMQTMAMQEQMKQREAQAAAAGGAAASDPLLMATSAKAPSQQQMM